MKPAHHPLLACLLAIPLAISWARAEDPKPAEPGLYKHQITGLFSREREADLAKTLEELPDLQLVSVDFDNAEATFRYDAKKVLVGTKPEEAYKRIDQLLKQASRHCFGAKPLCTIPRDKLELVEIPIAGLDCKGCCLAVYEIVARIDGVERATASFKDRRLTAMIDPAKTNRAALEAALKQRGVEIPSSGT